MVCIKERNKDKKKTYYWLFRLTIIQIF
jgi:hypothetical protein